MPIDETRVVRKFKISDHERDNLLEVYEEAPRQLYMYGRKDFGYALFLKGSLFRVDVNLNEVTVTKVQRGSL